MSTNKRVFKLVLTALMMCIIMLAILFVRIPIPFTQGYVHPGDAMIFLSILLLGWKYGAVAAAFGGMLGDVMGGFAAWAPWTFGIKGIMAVIMGVILEFAFRKAKLGKKGMLLMQLIAMTLSGIFMAAGYFVAEGLMYGNWAVAAIGLPWNIGQFAVGMVLAVLLSEALAKTPAKSHFAYSLNRKSA